MTDRATPYPKMVRQGEMGSIPPAYPNTHAKNQGVEPQETVHNIQGFRVEGAFRLLNAPNKCVGNQRTSSAVRMPIFSTLRERLEAAQSCYPGNPDKALYGSIVNAEVGA